MLYFLFNPVDNVLITHDQMLMKFSKTSLNDISELINKCSYNSSDNAKLSFYNLDVDVSGFVEKPYTNTNIRMHDFEIFSLDEETNYSGASWMTSLVFNQTNLLNKEDKFYLYKINLRKLFIQYVRRNYVTYDDNLEVFLQKTSNIPNFIVLYDTEQGCNEIVKEFQLPEEKVFSRMSMLSCSRSLKKIYNLTMSEVKYLDNNQYGYYFLFKSDKKEDVLAAKLSSRITPIIIDLQSCFNEFIQPAKTKILDNYNFSSLTLKGLNY